MAIARFFEWPLFGEKEGPITGVTVSGYKSIMSEQSIEIRPLTILAGANSSGKSSIMQPLLLLKQTLESSYDPGPLLLDGENVRFTSEEQFFSKKAGDIFSVGIQIAWEQSEQRKQRKQQKARLTLKFSRGDGKVPKKSSRGDGKGPKIQEMIYSPSGRREVVLSEAMTHEEVKSLLWSLRSRGVREIVKCWLDAERDSILRVIRDRCFLKIVVVPQRQRDPGEMWGVPLDVVPRRLFSSQIERIIHLPGLRGNPRRAYPRTAVGLTFPGIFHNYTASVIDKWQTERRKYLGDLGQALRRLGLTWKVKAKPIDQTQLQLRVGRPPRPARGGARDLVDIADVGFGVSQVLPVLVALREARPGQLVYLEQPEIHLHPKAQHKLAWILADAAKRGVRVVAETHSALLLLGVQAAVAEGYLPPDLVKLHWFERDREGCTRITSADLDERGAFGEDWPEDFAVTELEAQKQYLDAAGPPHRG